MVSLCNTASLPTADRTCLPDHFDARKIGRPNPTVGAASKSCEIDISRGTSFRCIIPSVVWLHYWLWTSAAAGMSCCRAAVFYNLWLPAKLNKGCGYSYWLKLQNGCCLSSAWHIQKCSLLLRTEVQSFNRSFATNTNEPSTFVPHTPMRIIYSGNA